LTPPGPAGGDDEPVAREDEDEGEHDDAERADGGDAAAEVVRSEEELVVGTRRRPTHRVRLKKYVVTDHVKRTVPVQREEVRVEYEPSEGEQRPARDEDVPRGADPA
jgi:stress response protein YsnF